MYVLLLKSIQNEKSVCFSQERGGGRNLLFIFLLYPAIIFKKTANQTSKTPLPYKQTNKKTPPKTKQKNLTKQTNPQIKITPRTLIIF